MDQVTVRDFALPDLGEGLTESELVEWHVAVGDLVTLNQPIAEVETAKAIVQLPSPFAGTIARLYAEAGSTVAVGTPIAAFEVDDGAPSLPEPATVPEPVEGESTAVPESPTVPEPVEGTPPPQVQRNAVLVGYGPAVEGGARPKRKTRRAGATASEPAVSAAEPTVAARETTEHPVERPRSTPPVRKLAHDLGVDLATVTGTGDDGMITREDVQAAASGARQEPTQSDDDRITRIPIKGVRKHTAAAMVASAFTAPHVTEFLTIDVTATTELIASLRDRKPFAGKRLTMLAVVAKAVCIAISRTPSINSRWDEESGEILQFGYVNLGIAVATPRGLMVPNIPDADRLSLVDLTDALADLGDTARAGQTTPASLSNGTISITNVGVFGVDAGTPILNPGEAAILATGVVRRLPWEYEGEIALRDVMTLSLSFDHRLVDGEQGSRFLTDIGSILSNPGSVLTMV